MVFISLVVLVRSLSNAVINSPHCFQPKELLSGRRPKVRFCVRAVEKICPSCRCPLLGRLPQRSGSFSMASTPLCPGYHYYPIQHIVLLVAAAARIVGGIEDATPIHSRSH